MEENKMNCQKCGDKMWQIRHNTYQCGQCCDIIILNNINESKNDYQQKETKNES